MRATRTWIVTCCLLTAWIPAFARHSILTPPRDRFIASHEEETPSFAPAGLESRGQNFSLELPTAEFSPSLTLLGNLGGQDEAVEVWGEPDGELVMITKEDRTLWAATSTDNGATFAPAVRFAGPPFEAPIDRFKFIATGNTLYVAYLAGDPGGDVGLKLRSSSDMGRTWSLPSVLVARGNLRHGLDDLALHAVDGGRVAVLFHDAWEGRDVYAMVSSDYGVTWTTPVRLDAANAEGVRSSEIGDVQVSTTGTVHATFVQTRPGGRRIWYTRSIDGGATFTPEITFDSVVATTSAGTPDMVTFTNGTILIAYWDATADPGTEIVTVVRSTNDGASFTLSTQRVIAESEAPVQPRLLAATNFPDALLAYRALSELHLALTQDTGLTFGAPITMSGSSVAEYGMARTLNNEWVVAYNSWEWKPRIEVAVSTNGGVTWGFPKRADQGPGRTAESLFGGVTTVGGSNVFVAYRDRRDDQEASFNVYAADSPIAALDFTGRERRVDTDTNTSHYLPTGGTLTTEGSRVYVAMPILTEGHGAEMWVTRSTDGARTWQPIQKVSSHDTSISTVEEPVMRALSDGSVYLVWRRREVTVDLDYWDELVFVRSTDFGATWGPEVVMTGPIQYVPSLSYTLAANSLAVIVLWEEGNEIRWRRSTNQGTTFSTPSTLSSSTGSYSQYPVVCAQGDRFVFLYQETNPSTGIISPIATVSGSGGASWNTSDNLRPLSVFGDSAQNLSLDCNTGTGAVAFWAADHFGSNLHIESSRLTLIHDWSAPVSFPITDAWYNDVAWVGGSNYVATMGDVFATSVWTSRSTNGGLTWSAPLRHDDSAPQPITTSYNPQVASDGAGNVWFSWWDPSPGRGSIAMRHSADSGATFGPIRRADRSLPQGVSQVHPAYGLWAGTSVGVVAYGADRATSYGDVVIQTWDALDLDRDGSADAADCNDENAAVYPGAPEACDGVATDCNGAGWPQVPPNELDPDADTILNCAPDNCPTVANPTQADLDGDSFGDACDPDIDGDGIANASDCAPMDPNVGTGPPEVFPVQINKPTATTFQIVWNPVSGATAYDVARGTVTALRSSGDTSGASAQSCGQVGTTYSDTKPIASGVAWYFIIRGRSGVCTGGWGSSSAGTPRTTTACP